MYARQINGAEHTFGVSGKLIMNALVMYDHQTRTLWSHFTGTGVQGEMAGTELEFVPVTHTTWALWRDLHPDTLVLDKGGRYQSDAYESYYRDRNAGIIGETRKDSRLAKKEFVLGVEIGGSTKAYPFGLLEQQTVVNDTIGGRPVLVVFDPETDTALVYDRQVDGKALTFTAAEVSESAALTLSRVTIVDSETGSTWLALTGGAIDGELRGKVLERTVSHLSFWFAWKDWNPDTEVYQG